MNIKGLPKLTLFSLVFLATTASMLLSVYNHNLLGDWRALAPVFLWLSGGYIGYVVLGFDRLVDVYAGNPDTKLSTYIRESIAQGKYKQAWHVLYHNRRLQTRLTFRSVLFHLVWVALALFTITSTTAAFGKGFIMGLGLHLLLDEWDDYVKDKEILKRWLFWQVNRDVPLTELKAYMIIMTAITAIYFLLNVY